MRRAGLRGLILVAAILVAATGLASAWLIVPLAAGSPDEPQRPVRHEDPSAVGVAADSAAAFEWYLRAVSLFANWRFQEGRRLILSLELANLPVEIQGLVRDLSGIVIKEGSILEAADAWLREASALIDAGRIEEARPLLEQLSAYVRRGDILFEDAIEGFGELARRSNVEALPPDAPQRRAYESLQRAAARAKALLLAYGAVAKDPRSSSALGRLLPYHTIVSLSVPAGAYPGRPVEITGALAERAPAPSVGRRLTLRLNDEILAEFPPGPFRHAFVIPPGTLPGAHVIAASVPPQGRYLGTVARRDLMVHRATPALRMQWPRTVVVPGRIEVNGSAVSEFGQVARAAVQARIGHVSGATKTSEAGEFRAALNLPTTVGLVGPKTFTVRIVPAEPWHGPTEVQADVFVINMVSAGMAAAVLLPVGGVVYLRARRREGRVGRGGAGAPVLERAPGAVPGSAPAPVPVHAGAGAAPRDLLVALYIESLRLVEAATGVVMEPSATMREYERQVWPRLRGSAFEQLTGLAEAAVYSPHPVTPGLVDRARGLKARVEGETADGAS